RQPRACRCRRLRHPRWETAQASCVKPSARRNIRNSVITTQTHGAMPAAQRQLTSSKGVRYIRREQRQMSEDPRELGPVVFHDWIDADRRGTVRYTRALDR